MHIHRWEYKTLLDSENFYQPNQPFSKKFFTEKARLYVDQVVSPLVNDHGISFQTGIVSPENVAVTMVRFYDSIKENGQFAFNDPIKGNPFIGEHYLLRQRKGAKTDLAIKWRTSNLDVAKEKHRVKSTIGDDKIFKKEMLVPSDSEDPPGAPCVYSHNNKIKDWEGIPHPSNGKEWSKWFPDLSGLTPEPNSEVKVVNGINVEQLEIALGTLYFPGSNKPIPAVLDLWMNSGHEENGFQQHLCGEFSFTAKDDSVEQACTNFHIGLQGTAYRTWILFGSTKTNTVYHAVKASD